MNHVKNELFKANQLLEVEGFDISRVIDFLISTFETADPADL